MATQTDVPAVSPLSRFADPAPLGLAGFALTTTLLSGVNSGRISTGALVFVGMALFYGGLAQFCAGMWEFARNNIFGATAFGSFGAFWMGLGILEVFDHFSKVPMIGADGLTWFLFCWAVFTSYMLIASLRVSGAIALVFLLLSATYWALWIGAGLREPFGSGWTEVGGYLGFATAIAAFYASFAGIVNATWGRVLLPTMPLNRPLIKASS